MICCLKLLLVLFGLSCRQTSAGGCVRVALGSLGTGPASRCSVGGWLGPRRGRQDSRAAVVLCFWRLPRSVPCYPRRCRAGERGAGSELLLAELSFPLSANHICICLVSVCTWRVLFIFSARLRRSLFLFSSFLHCCFMRCVCCSCRSVAVSAAALLGGQQFSDRFLPLQPAFC